MPVYLPDDELVFPAPEMSTEDGLLAIGGDLRTDRLLLAYEKGIFPWYSDGQPIMWWSPDPRCLLRTDEVKITKSMRNILNRKDYKVTFDRSFSEVIRSCRNAKRDHEGTWITDEMIIAYENLFHIGVGHSVEVWRDDQLIGGLYGLCIGSMFCGESMFSLESNASKIALIHLCRKMVRLSFDWIDCQIYSEHLGSMGATEFSRSEYLEILENCLLDESVLGDWMERGN